jgi:serine/threonine protein kinase
MALNLSVETNIETSQLGPDGTVVTKRPPAPPLPLAEVSKLFPHLDIIGFLGRGGMGSVYKARQPRLDRQVALKILSPEKQGDAQFAERFEREARALARLNHSEIVAVYDFGEVQGHYYLLMEFVDGLTLRQLLRARRWRRRKLWPSCRTSAKRCNTRTTRASCTGTSSRRISSSTNKAG